MIRNRIIPCLLLHDQGLVKTTRFKAPIYLGDPINIVRIFNDKEADELMFLDIKATINKKKPNFELLSKIASECFMPLSYGGGVRHLDDMKMLFSLGIEKVALNSYAVENPAFICAAAGIFGSQSVIVSIDVKKNLSGRYEVYTRGGRSATGLDPVEFAILAEEKGAGEILLNAIEQDGTMQGYDIVLISRVSAAVNIPVIACGGAGKIPDFFDAVEKGGASAVAAGSLFVFQGPHRAVLISYPSFKEIEAVFSKYTPVGHKI